MSEDVVQGKTVRRPDNVPYPEHPEFDYCSCAKPPGVFCQGGWHLTKVPYWLAISHYGHESYAGTVVTVEPCPHYREKVGDEIKLRQAAEQRTKLDEARANRGGFQR